MPAAPPTDWQTIYERFNPEEPVPLDHPEWRSARPYSPATEIAQALNLGFGHHRYLIIGSIGSGKSTELHQIAEQRTERDFVVVADIRRHFEDAVRDLDALNHVQAWEVIFLIGLHLYRAGEAAGHPWSKAATRVFAKAITALRDEDDEVDLKQLVGTVAVTVGGALAGVPGAAAGLASKGLVAIGKVAKSEWRLPIGHRTVSRDQDRPVQDMLSAVNLLVGELQERGRPVSLFVDGLDRIDEVETVERLFVNSSLLGQLACTTIMNGPIVLRQRGYAPAVRAFDIQVLANVRVFDPDAPLALTPTGATFFREVWRKRTPAPEAIPEAWLDKLALFSGGRLREFVRMVNMTALQCAMQHLDAADEAVVDKVIDKRRRTHELGLHRGAIDLLETVLADRDHKLPDDASTEVLLKNFWLLPYPNRSVWYFPHPLLMMVALRGSST